MASPETTRYGYDEVGNLDWTELPSGAVVDYVFDAANRLGGIAYFLDTDGDHALDWADNGNGVWTSNEGERPLATFTYEHDAFSRRTKGQERLYSAFGLLDRSATVEWFYDEVGRLAREIHDLHGSGTTDQLHEYRYDLANNRTEYFADRAADALQTELFRSGVPLRNAVDFPTTPSYETHATYTIDANDRLLVEQYLLGNDGANRAYIEYQYGSGNLGTKLTEKRAYATNQTATSNYEKSVFGYDGAGRLILVDVDSVTYFGSVLGHVPSDRSLDQYTYSTSNHRVGQTRQQQGSQDQTITWLVDANNPTGYAQVLEETVFSNATLSNRRHYTLGLDVVAQSETGANGTLAFLTDALGSTRALGQANNSFLARYTYEAFGTMLSASGEVTGSGNFAYTNILYAGERTDPTGQVYLRARYYDPRSARFTTLDPFAGVNSEPASLHKYLYAHADPVQNTDPSGEFAIGMRGLLGFNYGSLLV